MASRLKRRRSTRATAQSMLQYVRDRASTSSSSSQNLHSDETSHDTPDQSRIEELSSVSDIDCNGDIFKLHEVVYEHRTSTSEKSISDLSGSEDEIMTYVLNEEPDNTILCGLSQRWAVNKGVTHSAIRELLHLLHPYHPELPLDPRTLLRTGTVDGIVPMEGGFYFHFGVANALTR